MLQLSNMTASAGKEKNLIGNLTETLFFHHETKETNSRHIG
jgi:hypothetical protein